MPYSIFPVAIALASALVFSSAPMLRAMPEMDVQQPTGNSLTNGGTRDFGSVSFGANASLVFTVENTGDTPLNLTGTPVVSVSGANAGDFTVTTQPSASVVGVLNVANSSFETPAFAIGNWSYAPSGSGWTFGGTAGIARNNSPWFVATVPEGVQAAFIQRTASGGATGAMISRSVNFPAAGSYTIRFSLVRRSETYPANDIAVTMDGTTLATVSNLEQPDDVWHVFTVSYICTVAGNHTLAFAGMRTGGDYASALDAVQIAETTTSFQVTFAPTAPGQRTASLSIANDDSDENPYEISLIGLASSPQISVQQPVGTILPSGANQDFGSQGIGIGQTITFTIRNLGDASLNLSGTPKVAISGADPGDFTVTAQPASPVFAASSFEIPVLPPGGWVKHPPPGDWTFENYTGVARNGSEWYVNPAPEGMQAAFLFNNDDNVIHRISRTVNFPVAGPYQIVFSVAKGGNAFFAARIFPAVNFRLLAPGEVEGADDVWRVFSRTYNCTVPGNHVVSFHANGYGGSSVLDDLRISTGEQQIMGAATTFQVTFAPTAFGTRTATLSIAHDDRFHGAYALTLTGTGVPPEIAVEQPVNSLVADGGSRDFGSLFIGSQTNFTFTLRNIGQAPLNLTGTPLVAISGPNADAFTVTMMPSSTVDVGSETTFQVAFNPTTAGSQTAALSISNNDGDENPYDIALTGIGLLIPKIVLEQPAGVRLFRDPVISWGDEFDAQTSVPTGLKSVRAIAAGYRSGAAIKFDGTVVAWGRNSEGQLNGLAGLTNVQSVVFGGGHSVVLKNDGTVVAGGKNSEGQANVPPGLTGVRAIAAGTDFTLALKNDGTVVAWGDNTYGQTNLPAGLTGIQAVSAGDWHGLALKSNGVVVAWGDNSQTGQTNIPTGLTNVIAIEAASFTSAALKADGTVVAWGYPLFDPVNQIQVPPGLSGVQAIAAGYAQMYALKTNGTIVAWGAEADSSQIDVPPGLDDVRAIAAGRESGFALVNGTVIFADQIIQTTSAAKTVVLKSVGPGPLSVSGVSVLGKNAAEFAVDINGMLSTIPANGQTTFQVTFTPAAAGLRETTLRVVSDDPAASPFDVALVGTGVDTLNALQAWRQLHFGIIADSGNAANAFDFDNDGLVNILEFAFGQNPTLATSAQPPQVEISGGNIFYSFTEPPEICCITYGAEWSTTLQANHWNTIADTGTGPHHIFSIPIASQTNIFIRLTVSVL